jgi:hypothetical protein
MSALPPELQATLDRARGEMPGLGGVTPSAGLAQAAIDAGIAPDPHAGNGEAAPGSVLAGLREQHRRIAARTSTIIELPFWQGKLATRYHYLDERVLGRMLSMVTGATDPMVALEANTDLLIGGCDEVLARRDQGEPWGPVVEGERLRYDRRLAELLQLDASTARETVHALFGGRIQGAMAIGKHAANYIEWLQGETPGVVESLQGESETPAG